MKDQVVVAQIEPGTDRKSRNALYLIGGRGGVGLVMVASTITIARLLSPAAYGVAAMALVLVGFFGLFRDCGLSRAILRKSHVGQEELSFLFWCNLVMTSGLVLLLLLLAGPIAGLFRMPQVETVLTALLPGFFIGGVTIQHAAILEREMRFRAISTIAVISASAGFVAGLAIAIVRRDVWALVASGNVQIIVSAALAIGATRWRPSRPGRIHGLREILAFGINNTAFALLNYASSSLPSLAIGPLFGPVIVGHLNRAQALFLLPINNLLAPIIQSVMPVLTRQRNDPAAYRETYLRLVGRLNEVMIPCACLLVFIAEPGVVTVLGERWAAAGMMLALLAPSLIAYGVNAPIVDLLVSQNRSSELRTQGVYDLVCRAIGLGAGLGFGALAAIACYSFATLLLAPLHIVRSGRTGPVSARDQWAAIAPALPTGLATIVGGIVGKVVSAWLRAGPLPELGICLVAGLGCFAIAKLCRKTSLQILFRNGTKSAR